MSALPQTFPDDTGGHSLDVAASSERDSAFASAATLKRLVPWLDFLGITRVADITGLDRIGIPVMQAVRPLGLANSVSQGKGPDHETAAVTAIMEAAEQFFAERLTHFDVTVASAAALEIPETRFARYLLPHAPRRWSERDTAWVTAADLISGRNHWLPLELVHTAFIEPPIASDGIFCGSSTGLACSFQEHEAIVHGLLECVERDAIARAHETHGFFQRYRIDPTGIDEPNLLHLLETVGGAGLLTAFWISWGSGNIPVLWCQIMEDGTQPLIIPYPSQGFAAGLDLAAAARRSLLEAAQSRLAAISGGRDDITRRDYPARTDWAAIQAHRRLLAQGPRPIAFASIQDEIGAADDHLLDHLVSRLAKDGISSVLLVRLDTDPFRELAAERVVVPELWPMSEI